MCTLCEASNSCVLIRTISRKLLPIFACYFLIISLRNDLSCNCEIYYCSYRILRHKCTFEIDGVVFLSQVIIYIFRCSIKIIRSFGESAYVLCMYNCTNYQEKICHYKSGDGRVYLRYIRMALLDQLFCDKVFVNIFLGIQIV